MPVNCSYFALICFLSCCLGSLPSSLNAQEEPSSEEAAEQAAKKAASEGGSEASGLRTHLIPEVIEQAALADEALKKQIVWLDTPEGTDGATIPFLGLENLEQSAEVHGAVLLLHGVEQHPDWPQVIKPLRTVLPEDGWYTLSVMLPYENYAAVPARELSVKENDSVLSVEGVARFSGRSPGESEASSDSQENAVPEDDSDQDKDDNISSSDEEEPTETAEDLENADESESEELIDISSAEKSVAKRASLTFDSKVQLRVDSAFAKMAEKGYQNIVLIGYQQGAQSLLNYLSVNKRALPEKGLTVIWVDARLEYGQSSLLGDLLGDEFSILLLDVVDSTSRERLADAKIRAGVAKRKTYEGYTQIKFPIADMAGGEVNAMNQRIRAWLKVNAPGTIVTGAEEAQ